MAKNFNKLGLQLDLGGSTTIGGAAAGEDLISTNTFKYRSEGLKITIKKSKLVSFIAIFLQKFTVTPIKL